MVNQPEFVRQCVLILPKAAAACKCVYYSRYRKEDRENLYKKLKKSSEEKDDES